MQAPVLYSVSVLYYATATAHADQFRFLFFWKGGDSGWAVIPAGSSRPAATSFAPKAAF
jgi:hypothetical protein